MSLQLDLNIILSIALSVLFVFLVFVTKNEKEVSKEDIQKKMNRKILYTYRLNQIQKVCKKYGLSASKEENIHKSKYKKIQLEFLRNAIPPFSDKVYITVPKRKLRKLKKSFLCRLLSCILKTTHCSIAGLTKLLLLHGTEYFWRRATWQLQLIIMGLMIYDDILFRPLYGPGTCYVIHTS